MSIPEIRRIPVWPGSLRIIHWLISLCLTVLLATGGLLPYAPTLADLLLDLHYPAGHILAGALLARLYFFVTDRGVGMALTMAGLAETRFGRGDDAVLSERRSHPATGLVRA